MSSSSIVIVPTYNERENILSLLEFILGLSMNLDVLVVDDNSPDGTARIVEHEHFSPSEDPPRVHLLERRGKLGLGSAYRDGFRFCLERSYEKIFQMDADFSHDPQELKRIYEELETSDLVLGARYIRGGGTLGWPLKRRLLSRGANLYARFMVGLPYHDLTGGFKGFRRAVLEKIEVQTTRSQGYAFQIETTTRAHWMGFKIREVPILFRDRELGKSKLSGNVVSEAVSVVLKLASKRFSSKKF